MVKSAGLIFLVTISLGLASNATRAGDEARPAIIDSSENTKHDVKLFADLGVSVIGRYYARCPQWQLVPREQREHEKKDCPKLVKLGVFPQREYCQVRFVPYKRLIDNAGEVDAILGDERLAILSIYQFYSQELKFDSDRDKLDPKRAEDPLAYFLSDRPRKKQPKTVADFNDCITPTKPNTIEEDASLDAHAAVAQAKIVGQPTKTAIYFGVDFNLTGERRNNLRKYFKIIQEILTKNDYEVGVYGNGSVSDLLYEEGLAKYVWLNGSSGHEGSAMTYNNRHWDLLQTKTDTTWEIGPGKDGNARTAELDTNMQNPKNSSHIGFWKHDKGFIVPRDRNVMIHSARRFVCELAPKIYDDQGAEVDKPVCSKTYGIAVRVYELNASKNLIRVDCNEDGVADALMKIGDLSSARPLFDVSPKTCATLRNGQCMREGG
jgi:hypothetical protein